MRKALIFGGVTLVTLMITVAIWIQFPRETDSGYISQTVEQGQKYFVDGQTESLNPDKNGYLNKNLISYWGRKGKEGVENSVNQGVVTGWNNYSSSATGRPIDHKKLLSTKETEYLKSRDGIRKLAPELEKSMRSETFVAPETKFDFETLLMNYTAVRACAQAMSGLAESEAASGEFDLAAHRLGSVFRLSRALQGKGAIINEMISASIGSVGNAGCLGLLGPKAPLSLKARQDLARDILSSVPAKGRLLGLLQGEVACGLALFDQIRKGTGQTYTSSAGIPSLHLPGLAAREERIYRNVHTRLLKELESTGNLTLTRTDISPSALDYTIGATGLYTQILLPNIPRLQEQLDLDRRARIAVGATYAALAFRAEKSRLPKDLQELGTAYPLPDDSATLGLTYTSSGNTGTIHIPYDKTQDFFDSLKQFSGIESWVKAEGDGLTFTI